MGLLGELGLGELGTLPFNINEKDRAIYSPSKQAIAKNQHALRLWVAQGIRPKKYKRCNIDLIEDFCAK